MFIVIVLGNKVLRVSQHIFISYKNRNQSIPGMEAKIHKPLKILLYNLQNGLHKEFVLIKSNKTCKTTAYVPLSLSSLQQQAERIKWVAQVKELNIFWKINAWQFYKCCLFLKAFPQSSKTLSTTLKIFSVLHNNIYIYIKYATSQIAIHPGNSGSQKYHCKLKNIIKWKRERFL